MKINIKCTFLFLCLLMFFISIPSFASETGGISFDEEVNRELAKITVEPTDRMTLNYYREYVTGVKFKNKDYRFLYSKVTLLTLLELIHSAGEETENLFKKAIDFYTNRRLGSWQLAEILIREAVEKFNEMIAKSEDVRKKAAVVYQKIARPEIEQRVRQKHLEIKWEGKKLLYLGVMGGFLASMDLGVSEIYTNVTGGLRFEYFFRNPAKPTNVGISFGSNLLSSKPDREYVCNYISLNTIFLLKFFTPSIGYKHNFVLGIGGEINLKISGDSTLEYGQAVRNAALGAIFEIGYRYVSTEMSTTFGFNFLSTIRDSIVKRTRERYSFNLGFNAFLGFMI